MPLFIAPSDTDLRIAKILTDEKTKRHLLNLGLCVGTTIRVVSSTPRDIIVKVLETTLALNKETALKIIVA